MSLYHVNDRPFANKLLMIWDELPQETIRKSIVNFRWRCALASTQKADTGTATDAVKR